MKYYYLLTIFIWTRKKTIIYTFSTLLLTMSLWSLAFASWNFKYISWETYLKIEQKLSTFTKARLEEISSVIDSIIPNTNSTTDKWIYWEFKTMVDEKISQTWSSNWMPWVPPGWFGSWWINVWTSPWWFKIWSWTALTPPWTWTSNSNVEINASTSWITLSTWTKDISSWEYTSTQEDESVVVVTNSWVLNLSNVTIDKSWDVSNTENSEFYWLNSWVIAKNWWTLNITDSTVKTTSNWANWVFSTKNSTVNLSNVTVVTTAESWARWLDATYWWTINADRVNISTVWIHSAASATDRGEGNVTITNSVLQTIGQDSPAIYSTWKFVLKNTTWIATWTEAAVIEWQNSISLTDCILKWMKNWWVMIYQSFSGDTDWHWGVFSMTLWSLTATNWPLFYSANTTWYINLSDVDLQADSWILVQATSNSRWWQTGSNWANLIINTTTQTLTWDITADSISTVQMTLKNSSILNWAINTDKTAKSVNISLDLTSTWNLTKDSYVNVISANISWTTITNIKWNWFTVYYKTDENTSLWWKTYSLSNWGYLKPY